MEVHRLALGVVAVLRHAAAMRAQFIIGVQRAVTGNQLHRLAGAQQPLQAVKMVKEARIDRFNLIGAIIAEQMIKPHQLFFIVTFAVEKLGFNRFTGMQVIQYQNTRTSGRKTGERLPREQRYAHSCAA